MAGWTALYAATAMIAAVAGFGGAAGALAGLGQIVFFVSLVALLVSVVLAAGRSDPQARAEAVSSKRGPTPSRGLAD
jgi:uncharacterized membrane protein YtjA (UPF0391 family)